MNTSKRLLCALLLFTVLLTIFSTNVFSYPDNAISSIEMTNSTWYGYPERADIYTASSIAYMGAEWSTARQAWAFNFRFAGTGSAHWNNGGNANLIRFAGMQIRILENSGNTDFWTSNSAHYLGSAPESGIHPNYGSIASAVVGLAITAINNLGASYAWSVAGLIAAFVNTYDGYTDTTNQLYRSWNWSPDQPDVGQFFWFLVDVKPNNTSKMSSDYYLIGPGYELLDAGTSIYNLTASTPGQSGIIMNPEIMSEEDKIRCGIETIARGEFKSRASQLNISERSQEEFLDSQEEVFYYAHNFLVWEGGRSSQCEPEVDVNHPTISGLIEKILYQLDRSEKIVKGLSEGDIANEIENIRICEKHSRRINQLTDLLSRIEGQSDENDIDTISILNTYNMIVGEFGE